jgi:hypothetical protein
VIIRAVIDRGEEQRKNKFEVLSIAKVELRVFGNVRPCSLVNMYYVSEERAAFIFGTETFVRNDEKYQPLTSQ